MALFRRKAFFRPEILIAIVINVIAAVLVYYATSCGRFTNSSSLPNVSVSPPIPRLWRQ